MTSNYVIHTVRDNYIKKYKSAKRTFVYWIPFQTNIFQQEGEVEIIDLDLKESETYLKLKSFDQYDVNNVNKIRELFQILKREYFENITKKRKFDEQIDIVSIIKVKEVNEYLKSICETNYKYLRKIISQWFIKFHSHDELKPDWIFENYDICSKLIYDLIHIDINMIFEIPFNILRMFIPILISEIKSIHPNQNNHQRTKQILIFICKSTPLLLETLGGTPLEWGLITQKDCLIFIHIPYKILARSTIFTQLSTEQLKLYYERTHIYSLRGCSIEIMSSLNLKRTESWKFWPLWKESTQLIKNQLMKDDKMFQVIVFNLSTGSIIVDEGTEKLKYQDLVNLQICRYNLDFFWGVHPSFQKTCFSLDSIENPVGFSEKFLRKSIYYENFGFISLWEQTILTKYLYPFRYQFNEIREFRFPIYIYSLHELIIIFGWVNIKAFEEKYASRFIKAYNMRRPMDNYFDYFTEYSSFYTDVTIFTVQ